MRPFSTSRLAVALDFSLAVVDRLAWRNWCITKSGQGRDTNRHNYTPAEIEEALQQPVTQAIIALARVRKHPAFNGEFSWNVVDHETMRLEWNHGSDRLSLEFKTTVGEPSFVVEATSADGVRRFTSVEELATY